MSKIKKMYLIPSECCSKPETKMNLFPSLSHVFNSVLKRIVLIMKQLNVFLCSEVV